MQHFHEKRYELGAYMAMPNHCHVIIRPQPDFELENIVGSWKRWTSNQLGGANLWQEESYDQIVRDTWHLDRVLRYMAKNPEKANLSQGEFSLWMCDRWKQAGWDLDSFGAA